MQSIRSKRGPATVCQSPKTWHDCLSWDCRAWDHQQTPNVVKAAVVDVKGSSRMTRVVTMVRMRRPDASSVWNNQYP